MKIKSLSLILILFVAVANSLSAQKKIYFDASWKKTKAKNATYYRIVTPEGTKFTVKDYFIKGDQLQMEGQYTSKKLENESRTGVFTTYYSNGQKSSEGEFISGKSNGEWNLWYKSGKQRAKGEWTNGDRTGKWVYYHKNGNLRSTGNYLKGEQDGTWYYFYDNNDSLEVLNLSKGKKDGRFIVFHKGGQVHEKGAYEKDSLEGMYEEYWENGNQAAKGEFKDNKKHGEWEWFHNNGKSSCKAEFKKGNFVKANFYNEEGEKQKDKVFKDDLVDVVEYTGGEKAMYTLISEQVGKKVDLMGAKKAKYFFLGQIKLSIDEKGNITKREWLLPDDVEEEGDFEDTWAMVENINSAIDDFPRFKPQVSYNRKVKSYYTFYYAIDFSKLKL
ncbi:MAG: hypothetical protein V4613_14940 [Bacteroidota bacterium]